MQAVVTGYADAEQKHGRLQRVYTLEVQDDQGRAVERETVHFKLHKPQSSSGVQAALEDRKSKMLDRVQNRSSIDWDSFVDGSS